MKTRRARGRRTRSDCSCAARPRTGQRSCSSAGTSAFRRQTAKNRYGRASDRDSGVYMDVSALPDDPATTELLARLRRGDLPKVKPLDPLAPGDECHFVAPVRYGRRRADQYGHLVLTGGWLKFRGGTSDVSVAWSEVASLHRAGTEIVIALRDSRRLLRFSCHSESETARGFLIAQHLVQSAQPPTADSGTTFQHAAV